MVVNMKRIKVALLFISVVFFTACGGGGGSSSPQAESTPSNTTPSNTPPSVSNVSLTIDEDKDGTGTITATDSEGDTLSYEVSENTQNGILTLNTDGTFTYTPNADYFGSDSAKILVSDGTNTVSITVSISIIEVVEETTPTAVIKLAKNSVIAGEKISILGEESHVQNSTDSLTFEWTLTPPRNSETVISTPNDANIELDIDSINDYTIKLKVTDKSGNSDTDILVLKPAMPNPIALPIYPPATPPTITLTDTIDAVRLLQQATFGPTVESVAYLEEMGAEAWFNEQISIPMSSWVELRELIGKETGDLDTLDDGWNWLDSIFLIQARVADDQLRQRVTFALSQLFVVSKQFDTMSHTEIEFTSYWDMLSRNALGNFRNLLEETTLHPTMGMYLNTIGNKKADPEKNIRPDENFARESMQLFTIGLYELNQDGSTKLDDNGRPIETYSPEVIQNYAAALTGWYFYIPEYEAAGRETYNNFGCGPACYPYISKHTPMVSFDHIHQKTAKRLLNGYYIPAGTNGEQDLQTVLDSLFNHQNLGPFIAKHFIRHLVTSNPSPGYVSRVSAVFNNNGEGVRGDLSATIKAVLFDQEARNRDDNDAELYGKVKETIIAHTNIHRLFDIQMVGGIDPMHRIIPSYSWLPLDNFSDMGTQQTALNAESVFNFYQPNFSPIGAISDANLVAPEMQISSEANVLYNTEYYRWVTTRPLWEHDLQYEENVDSNSYQVAYNFSEIDKVWDEEGYEGVIEFLNVYLTAGRMNKEYKKVLLDLQTYPEYEDVFDDQPPSWSNTWTIQMERHAFLTQLVYMIIATSEFRVQE